MVLGADGLLGFSTSVAIDDGTAGRVDVRATRGLDLTLALDVDETVRTSTELANRGSGAPMNFLQLGGLFRVKGRVAGRDLDFVARGSAETFKPRSTGAPP